MDRDERDGAPQQTTTLKALRAMVAHLEYQGVAEDEPLTFVLMGEDIWVEPAG